MKKIVEVTEVSGVTRSPINFSSPSWTWEAHEVEAISIEIGDQGFPTGRFELRAKCGARLIVDELRAENGTPHGQPAPPCAGCGR